ncbi:recombinase family protein [Endozoicomonas sp. ALB115]|uniref:recombinase family protein n=1 Tax=Endozoicomonas sp. ALB115 TaxID=3403074 RepID=UPI003BB59EC3
MYHKPVILGYVRVSSEQQKRDQKGIRRQITVVTEASEQLSKDHSIPFVDVVRDEGLSAFHRTNVEEGILGDIISGKYIPSGSILVIENYDRFSRSDALYVLSKLKEIIDHGISVFVCHQSKMIDSVSILDTSNILMSVMQISLAHEESMKKSNRMKAIYSKQIEEAKKGTGKIRIGGVPSWITKRDDQYVFMPERVKTLRKIIDMYIGGMGAGQIAGKLNDDNVPIFKTHTHKKSHGRKRTTDKWHSSFISRVLYNEALIGVAKFKYDGEEIKIPNYFPKVINRSEYNQIEVIRKQRTTGQGRGGRKGVITGFLTGNNMTKCFYCGSGMIQKFDARHKRGNGKHSRNVVCSGFVKKYTHDHCSGGTMGLFHLENSILRYCSDEINWSEVFGDESATINGLKNQLADKEDELAKLNKRQHKLMNLLLDDDDDEMLKEKYKQQKKQINGLKIVIQGLNDEISVHSGESSTIKEQFLEILENAEEGELSEDVRMKLRVVLPKFIEKIEIANYGVYIKKGHKLDEYVRNLDEVGVDEESKEMFLTRATNKDRSNGCVYVKFKTGEHMYLHPKPSESGQLRVWKTGENRTWIEAE